MRWPWVSRSIVVALQEQITSLKEQATSLKEINAQLLQLVQDEKEARREAVKKAEEGPEDSTSRKPRVFGEDVRKRATRWAEERAKEGKQK